MGMHFFSSAQLPATPWKNGGGTTQEVVCWPQGAGLVSFQWRISIAEIASNGPFSAFAGIDRTITLLTGDGVHLRAADGSVDHALQQPLAPFAFSGDVALDCTLLGGASQDFNVMVRRGAWQATVRPVQGVAAHTLARAGLLLANRGRWHLQGVGADAALQAGAADGVYWVQGEGAAISAAPASADAQLLLVELTETAAR